MLISASRSHDLRAAPEAVADPAKPDVVLSANALRRGGTVAAARRLHAVAAACPHLLDRVADLWDDAQSVERYLDDLLLTGRTGRRGLPPAVVAELTELREKNRSRLTARAWKMWSEATLR